MVIYPWINTDTYYFGVSDIDNFDTNAFAILDFADGLYMCNIANDGGISCE